MTMQFLRLFTFMLKYCEVSKIFSNTLSFSFYMPFVIYSYQQTIKFNIKKTYANK